MKRSSNRNDETTKRRWPRKPLCVTSLEDRLVPAAIWPIQDPLNPGNLYPVAQYPLIGTYGQYQELTDQFRQPNNTLVPLDTSIHFHEGIDIQAPPTTPVVAVMDGILLDASGAGYQSIFVVKDLDGNKGWNYKHVELSPVLWEQLDKQKHSAEPTKGIRINAGQTIGRVAAVDPELRAYNIPAHMHLDRGNQLDTGVKEPNKTQQAHKMSLNYAHVKSMFAPNLNPLLEFDNALDTIKPTVDGISFRVARDEKYNVVGVGAEVPRDNAHYFHSVISIGSDDNRTDYRYLGSLAWTQSVVQGYRTMSAGIP